MPSRYPLPHRLAVSLLCAAVLLLPAARPVFTQPPPPRQRAERRVTFALPELLRGAGDEAARVGNLNGYTSGGKFVPDGPVLLSHANARPALRGLYRDGQAEGEWRVFYPGGRVQTEMTYRGGKPEGVARRYWPDGKLAREEEYSGGKLQAWRVYDSKGARQREFRKKGDEVVYGYWRAAQGEIVADVRQAAVKFTGSHKLRFTKACRLTDGGDHRCKTPYQIWRDLNTFIAPETAMSVLAQLNARYGEAGLNAADEVLAECGGGQWSATRVQDGAVAQRPSRHRARMTQPEINGLRDGCRDAQIAHITGGSRGGGTSLNTDEAYQNQVSNIKAGMKGAVEACYASQEFDRTDEIASGAVPHPVSIGIGDVNNALDAIKTAKELFWDDDGWTAWTDDPISKSEEAANTQTRWAQGYPEGSYKMQVRERDMFSFYPGTVLIEEEKRPDGTISRKELGRNGRVTYTEKDASGEVVTRFTPSGSGDGWFMEQEDTRTNTQRTGRVKNGRYYWDKNSEKPIDPDKPMGTPPPAPAPAPAPEPAPAPDPKLYTDPWCAECRAGNCARLEAWWNRFSTYCDRSGWQTYDCSTFVRRLYGCVDTAEIRPGPDGDFTCSRAKMSDDEARRRDCERRKMFESFVEPGSVEPCDGGGGAGKKPVLMGDVCNDPRAQCKPDRLVIESLAEDGTRFSERPAARP